MVEKKTTDKKTTAAAPKKAAAKPAAKKPTAKKAEIAVDGVNVGFRAGDVYQALSTAGKALSVAEIAKEAKITKEEVLLGMGWLFKEGKIKDDGKLITLA